MILELGFRFWISFADLIRPLLRNRLEKYQGTVVDHSVPRKKPEVWWKIIRFWYSLLDTCMSLYHLASENVLWELFKIIFLFSLIFEIILANVSLSLPPSLPPSLRKRLLIKLRRYKQLGIHSTSVMACPVCFSPNEKDQSSGGTIHASLPFGKPRETPPGPRGGSPVKPASKSSRGRMEPPQTIQSWPSNPLLLLLLRQKQYSLPVGCIIVPPFVKLPRRILPHSQPEQTLHAHCWRYRGGQRSSDSSVELWEATVWWWIICCRGITTSRKFQTAVRFFSTRVGI